MVRSLMLVASVACLAQTARAQDIDAEGEHSGEELIEVISSEPYYRVLNLLQYGEAGLDGETAYEGEEIKTASGLVVLYRIEPSEYADLQVEGDNVTLTNMTTGESRSVVPQGSGLLIFNWIELRVPNRGANEDEENYPVAYAALVGTRQDYLDGRLDLVIGRFSDLEQVTLAQRLRFVDSANAIDPDTLSLIAWDGPDSAEFLKIRLADFAIIDRKPVMLPQPETITEVSCGD